MLKICLQDLFYVYLNRFDFHFLQLHFIKAKQTNFAFSCTTDVSLVLPNRQDGNLKHNTVALNTSPSQFY